MPLSTFLTFLAFLTRKLRWIRANQKTLLEIRREALGRRFDAEQTRSLARWVGSGRLAEARDPEDGRPRDPSVGDYWSGRPESASTASTLCRALTRNSDRSASGSRARALALLAERT